MLSCSAAAELSAIVIVSASVADTLLAPKPVSACKRAARV